MSDEGSSCDSDSNPSEDNLDTDQMLHRIYCLNHDKKQQLANQKNKDREAFTKEVAQQMIVTGSQLF